MTARSVFARAAELEAARRSFAVATVVVSSATLMVTSLIRAQRVDLGFVPRGVLTARV